MNQADNPVKDSIKNILYLCLISTAFSQAMPASAQITPDNSLGAEASQLNQNVLINGALGDKINGGAIRKSNLFHSFSEFNIQDGQRVYFANPTGIENILTRVTGGNASNIFGTLGVDGAANLFLINPSGILFGQNAQLDVQGSFVGTTANGVQFGNQGIFSATNPQAPPLLTVNPSALFFNQINQGAGIQNNSIARAGTDPAGFNAFGLRVGDGKSLLLVGGNVSMDGGRLNAYGGRVELGGLTASGNVNLLFNGDNLSLKFPENVTRAEVSLTNQARVSVKAAGGGDIAVNARNLEILNKSVLDAGIVVGLGTPETVAGDITLNATEEIKIVDSESRNLVNLGAKGNGGNITIDSGDLSLRDGALLTTSTYGQGNGGNVTVNAKNAVDLANNAIIGSVVGAEGVGKGGNIDINAATLSLTNGALLATFTSSSVDTYRAGRGDAGNINILVGDLSLRDGARIDADTSGQGNAGNVRVSAKNAVDLAGNARIFSGVGAEGVGKGGNIDINAATLSLTDRAQLQTFTSGSSDSFPAGRGDAGNINILVGDLSLRDGARIDADTSGQGNAGNVRVSAKNAVDLAGNARISSRVGEGGVGKGGNIDINTATLSLIDGAQLLTFTNKAFDTQPAGRGDAGNVNILVTGAVDIAGDKNGVPSGIFSYIDTGTVGNGGNITIDSGNFSLRDGAVLRASTSGQGNAGNVTVSAKNAVDLVNARILSTVEAGGVGKGGNIDINAATLSLTDGALLLTSTLGQGNAGNVTVSAKNAVDLVNARILSTVEAGGVGKGGNIDINAATLSLTDGASLETSTLGQGNAGNVTVSAKNAVNLADSNILSTVEAGGVGKGGNININAANLSLTDSASLRTLTSSAFDTQPAGRGDAGNVNILVTGAVDIAGEKNGFPSGIFSLVDTGTVGNGGNITIDSGDFSLRDGAILVTSTLGQGNAGNVTVSAKNAVNLADSNILSTVEAGGVGKGGNININAANLSLTDSASLRTLTSSAFDTQPAGRGDAGNVNILVTGAVDIAGEKNGFPSGIFSLVDTGTVGNGGNITIDSSDFSLRDGAGLVASTLGQGNAGNVTVAAKNAVYFANAGILTTVEAGTVSNGGNIEINSPKITLDNQGKLSAESASGNGGNINVNSDLLLLRRGAQISTSAGTAQSGGDGGNININSKFIVAVPNENSDISANAFSGTGGNIQINSQGIFGIESRPKPTEKSDITASSELGVSGVTNINTPDNSSIQNSLTELPQNAIDTNALIANSCISRGTKRQENSFTITGSGALTPNRPGILVSNYTTGEVRGVDITSRRPWKKGDPIIEPQGLYQLPNGQLILSRSCS
ncbi:MAG: filamentous hemagglutinin N-terminal domain-containing protein [Nostoc sp. DedSLP03]|uniref:beta strand repeat-containing protein n=1 Tax=Nostoc sp. DedSLP03 TaxID=3075400 RepID=UPI002AD5B0D7|nr:filamentous hemagglutinin N-terminal domain-containing protein [Nostoc sp. DedSLP03]MDZ7968376.1 filamentous hemagglutinin N-terminal domain-containing protein [Nostoc sp. DedSLP03]